MINLESISFRYADANGEALSDIFLSIKAGEQVALVGPSGSGKTTLLAILGGLIKPSSGNYLFRGNSIGGLNARAMDRFRGAEVGFVFQNHALLAHLTVIENVLLPLDTFQLRRTNDNYMRAKELLARLGVADLADRYLHQISGGQAQRVAVARALIQGPALVLADEPTSALDEESARLVMSSLCGLSGGNRTLVVATHDSRLLTRNMRIVEFDAGRIVSC